MRARRAFFPLTGTLATYPVPEYAGSAVNSAAVPDPLFGYAAACARSDQPELLLDSVPYAAGGPFSLNLWFQARREARFAAMLLASTLLFFCVGVAEGRR